LGNNEWLTLPTLFKKKEQNIMYKFCTSLVKVFLFFLALVSTEASAQRLYEIPGTQVVPIQDTQSERQYELYIKLPEGYSKKGAVKHPVIYSTDAIWHFAMLAGSTEYIMPNAIVVGISWQKDLKEGEEHASRFRDYTFLKSPKEKHLSGEASNHLAFIRNDVIKYIEKNYRADPDQRTYFGYSLGGAFGAYVLFAQPDTFRNYILGSPALSVKSLQYLSEYKASMDLKQSDTKSNIFVSIGELEKTMMERTENFVSMVKRRKNESVSLNGPIVIEDADHGTAFPMTVVRSINWLSRLEKD
jgi:predicted alpha/beta superfamily hydrolase